MSLCTISPRTIKIDNSLIKILKLYKERQYKSKCLYEEYYKQFYVDNERRINTDNNGQEIHLINIRDDGSYIQPRVM